MADGISVEAWNGHYSDAELKYHAEYDQRYLIAPGIMLKDVF